MACSVESQTPGGLLCMCLLLHVVKWVEKLRHFKLSFTYHSVQLNLPSVWDGTSYLAASR
jgi:hypothetical protein